MCDYLPDPIGARLAASFALSMEGDVVAARGPQKKPAFEKPAFDFEADAGVLGSSNSQGPAGGREGRGGGGGEAPAAKKPKPAPKPKALAPLKKGQTTMMGFFKK